MKVRYATVAIVLLGSLSFLYLGGNAAQNTIALPRAPEGFEVSIFAEPPKVNYPVCLTAAPTGEVFVGVDPEGSLGRAKGKGSVVRCIDTNNDGKADKINTFAKVDHPRGLIYHDGKLWVLHPPFLSLYTDTDGDGKADKSETLITGITTDFLNKRGADHTTNGIRMGIDGWIYIAVGDFGFLKAKGKDGRVLTLKGGGVVRVRPDGGEMELYARGLRNILDVSIDPQLNMFTRDNTNDGGGWNVRLSHIVQSARYGYPSLFKNFSDEIMPPLADYGGGSGCGAMFVSEPTLPKPYDHALLTCDWGRSVVYYHPLKRVGPTYTAEQQTFVNIPRPTDIDVDGSGRLYISSWLGGQFRYKGPNVGYVAQLKPKGHKPTPFPNLRELSGTELVAQLQSNSHVRRFHTQLEILRRGPTDTILAGVLEATKAGPLNSRVAAIFTYKQLLGAKASPALVTLTKDETVREYALRALTDRMTQLQGVPTQVFVDALKDKNPRVQLAAMIGLGRLGNSEVAAALLPLATTKKAAKKRQGFRVAVKKRQVADIQHDITGAKKLYLVVGDSGDGNGNDHADWVEPRLVGPEGEMKLTDLKWVSAKAGWGGVYVNRNCRNQPMRIRKKQKVKYGIGTHSVSIIEYNLPKGYTTFKAQGSLDESCKGQGTVTFMVFADEVPELFGSTSDPASVLPHIAVRTLAELNATDACLQALDGPHRDAALWALRYMHNKKAVAGLIPRLRTSDVERRRGILKTLIRLYFKEGDYQGTWWGTRPDTTGPYYHREPWGETPRIEKVLRRELTKVADSDTVKMMVSELDRHRVVLKNLPPNLVAKAKVRDITPTIEVKVPKFDPSNPNQIGNLGFEKTLQFALKQKGKVSLGAKLFKTQSCVACHSVSSDQRPLGPSLIDIGKRYNRTQLIESILKPSDKIAQGFDTNLIQTKAGKFYSGFIVREAADEVELRTTGGKSVLLPTNTIARRKMIKMSTMPEGLVNNLTSQELASLVSYLESLRSK
ncbi:MAG: NPCBM/NEW2 domain-containing protein [Gemmataceae bacterium]